MGERAFAALVAGSSLLEEFTRFVMVVVAINTFGALILQMELAALGQVRLDCS